QRMMEHVIQVPRTIWYRVNWAWVGFFLFSGAANIWVAYQFPEAVWVNFKLFGLMGMTFVFMILQGLYLGLYAERPAEIETNPPQEGDKRQ
ncbi:MAG TPA: septation protein IspZ, partial [Guyparkeria sp.]|nr:septation protein IspZ [Guyparkeria sp.]